MLPLSGFTVVDFSPLVPGCYASMVLADLGARVVKIEAKNRADLLKEMQPKVGDSSAWYQVLNRNKEVIALDLKDTPADRKQLLQLVKTSDVVIEGFRPDVMRRLALDYGNLRQVNDQLIYCSISGYGQTGPYAERAGHDINFLAMSGINALAEGQPPVAGIQISDVCGGALYAVVAIMTAIVHRQRSGEGQYLDVSLFDTSVSLATAPLANYLATQQQPADKILDGKTNPFYGHYRTADGRYLSVGAIEEKFRAVFCATIGLPDSGLTREVIAKKIAGKTLDQWQKIFSKVDCCVEANLTIDELIAHQHCRERQLLVPVPTADGEQLQVAHPVKYSSFRPRYDFVGGTKNAT